jgi:hypothetical protein
MALKGSPFVLIVGCTIQKKQSGNFSNYWRAVMGFLTRLFGSEGVIRYEGECMNGQTFRGKCSIEVIGMDWPEIEESIKNMLYVEKGLRIRSLRVTGFYET